MLDPETGIDDFEDIDLEDVRPLPPRRRIATRILRHPTRVQLWCCACNERARTVKVKSAAVIQCGCVA